MYIHVKVIPNSKEEECTKLDENHFHFKVREKAEHNAANKRVLELVRGYFPTATQVKIVNGHHAPSKLISVTIAGE